MAGSNVNITLSELETALKEIGVGEDAYESGRTKITNTINDVNQGKIGGSVAQDLLNSFNELTDELDAMKIMFEKLTELFQKAINEYHTVSEETTATINKNTYSN